MVFRLLFCSTRDSRTHSAFDRGAVRTDAMDFDALEAKDRCATRAIGALWRLFEAATIHRVGADMVIASLEILKRPTVT